MNNKKKKICSECGHTSRDGYNAKRHLKTHVSSELKCSSCNFVHPSEAEVLAHKNTCGKHFTCFHCSFTFGEKSKLVRHMKIHLSQDGKPLLPNSKPENISVIRHQCSLCSSKFHRAEQAEAHLSVDHQIALEKKCLSFDDTVYDFQKWKDDMESSSLSSFVVCASSTNVSGEKTVYFRCFRSGCGNVKSMDTRKRLPHLLGTHKMGGFCPARMSMKSSREGKIFVTHHCTHVGHEFELARAPLSKSYRKYLAVKMRMTIPLVEILAGEREKAKRSGSAQQLQRGMLLTMTDLYNIARDFRIDKDVILHQNDAVSVEACRSVDSSNGPSIVIEKPLDDLPNLEKPNPAETVVTEAILHEILAQPSSPDESKEEFLQNILKDLEEIVRKKANFDEDFVAVREAVVSLDGTLSAMAKFRAAQLKPLPSIAKAPLVVLISPQKRFERKHQAKKRSGICKPSGTEGKKLCLSLVL